MLSLGVASYAHPQGGGDSDALAKELADAATKTRYGQNSGDVDQSIVDDVFGTAPGGKVDSGEDIAPGGVFEDDQFDNCTFYEPYGYKCVPYYQCHNGFIITDGGGLIDVRNGLVDPGNSKCESYLEVCCQDEAYKGVKLPTRPDPTTPKPVTTEAPPKTPAPIVNRCGVRNVNGVDVRIQNEDGEEYSGSTQFAEWPHMCAVLRKGELGGNDVNLYVCGASLIHPGVVLTAAHCVKDYADTPEVLKIRCGEWDTQQVIEPRRHEDRQARSVSLHPLFNPKNLQNDFALLHLEQEFVLQPHINTICLPDQNYDNFETLGCAATGWGKDKFGKEGEYQVIMKQVAMNMRDQDVCQDILRTTRLGTSFILDDSFVCAGGKPGKDTCKGDGGGPLVCPKYIDGNSNQPQQYVQTGIVAWGIGCGEEIPGVYAKVSEALGFIDWATKCEHGQDADYYGYTGYQRWAKKQYCDYKKELAVEESYPRSQRNFRRLAKLVQYVPQMEAAVKGCKSSPYYDYDDIDCSVLDHITDPDDIDLSDVARDSAPKADKEDAVGSSPRIAIDVDRK